MTDEQFSALVRIGFTNLASIVDCDDGTWFYIYTSWNEFIYKDIGHEL